MMNNYCRGEKMKSKLLFLLALVLISLTLLTACASDDGSAPVEQQQSQQEELSEEELEKEIEEIEDEYEAEISEEDRLNQTNYSSNSPFTGLPIKEDNYQIAMAVSIENSPAARPQSGLDRAEIIYEFMLEGGITRFLAIFWPDIPEKVGPIRSARPALIETASAYEALFLHAGASPDGFALLSNNNILHLDQIYQSQYYWRSSKRSAPHNLYSGRPSLEDYVNTLSGKEYPNQFKFLTASVISDFTEAQYITIDYWGSYDVLYRYNSLENNYLRFLNDYENPHTVENGEQLKAKNIIVQYVQTSTKDEQGRQKINLNTGGKIELFRDGIVIEGSWKKKNKQFVYLNNSGQEIEINPGQTWIQIVPNGTELSY